MIPDKSDNRWVDLLTGKKAHQFKSVPAGMCVSRNIRQYSHHQNPESMSKAIEGVHEFFVKYEKILGDDIKALFS